MDAVPWLLPDRSEIRLREVRRDTWARRAIDIKESDSLDADAFIGLINVAVPVNRE